MDTQRKQYTVVSQQRVRVTARVHVQCMHTASRSTIGESWWRSPERRQAHLAHGGRALPAVVIKVRVGMSSAVAELAYLLHLFGGELAVAVLVQPGVQLGCFVPKTTLRRQHGRKPVRGKRQSHAVRRRHQRGLR